MAVAVDLCSSPPLRLTTTTPLHLSFSKDSSPLHLDNNPTPPSSEFHFHTPTTTSSSSTAPADVLFSNGKLLPLLPFVPTPPPPPKETKKDEQQQQQHRLKELISSPHDEPNKLPTSPNKPAPSSPFWRFSRSTSVNHKPSGFTFSLHLLPRSRSTGSSSSSSSNPKQQQRRSSSAATTEPKCLRKSSSVPKAKAAPLPTSHYFGGSKKGAFGGGVRINPVLNVSGGGFFGFGYLFCGAREKASAGATKKKAALFSL